MTDETHAAVPRETTAGSASAAAATASGPPLRDDTIAAIATATGAAGLAVVRVSGPEALAVAGRVFQGAAPLAGAPSHTLHHGWAVEPETGERIDEVVAGVFRAPRSYTREDVVEISCHGGGQCAARVLAALLARGARMARPGEFTWRAFANGRIDLAQAEAVADLIAAESAAAHTLAVGQLAGELSREVARLEEALADALAEVEARVDFADDVGGVEVPPHVRATIAATAADLEQRLAGAAWARAVREGVSVPLVGRPNVGKSSLFNALVGGARAIVTPVPGTTRDRVSEGIEIAGVRITLSDTAGLRATDDAVESIGVERARAALASGALVLWVVDASAALDDEDRAIAASLSGRPVIVALNKSDRPGVTGATAIEPLLDGAARRIVAVSALQGEGLDHVRAAIGELLGAGGFSAAAGNPRHAEAFARARAALARAATAAHDGLPGEIVALELREAIAALGEVTGRSVADDLLERIFQRFCVGK